MFNHILFGYGAFRAVPVNPTLGLMGISSITVSLLGSLFDRWIGPLYIKFSTKEGITIGVERRDRTQDTIDERLSKIEAARRNLEDALAAMNELAATAEQNKVELAAAMKALEAARKERSSAERELESIKKIAEADIQAFRKLAGVPNKVQVAKERFIGFTLGVMASVLASGVWWLITKAVPLLRT